MNEETKWTKDAAEAAAARVFLHSKMRSKNKKKQTNK